MCAYVYLDPSPARGDRCDPFLAEWKDKPNAFGKAYQMQFTAYAQGAYPFTTPLTAGQTPLQWWMTFERTEHGGILVVSSFSTYTM